MNFIDQAQSLAAQGFYVFPITAGKKAPPRVPFKEWATRDAAKIAEWWTHNPHDNIGIYTGKFADDEALIVVDVDNKGEKNGSAAIFKLELEGFEFPPTLEIGTPSGGYHLYYRSSFAVAGGVDVFGVGVDIRSAGGYVLAPGCTIETGEYVRKNRDTFQTAPDWMGDACARPSAPQDRHPSVEIGDAKTANSRAVDYLKANAPLALEGEAGDLTTYRVAAKVKDFGVSLDDAKEIMVEWNARCSPPWDYDDLCRKIENAYQYGKEAQGSLAPERVFSPVAQAPAPDVDFSKSEHPLAEINKRHGFVIAGNGHYILHETTNAQGKFELKLLPEATFHAKYLSKKITFGDGKTTLLTKHWMASDERREYKGLCFRPDGKNDPRFYNLWRGFAVAPSSEGSAEAHWAVDAFFDHALTNVCNGDPATARWLMGYFAHMFQRPGEKPLTALVFKGEKGVGKNALVERIAWLLGNHALLTSSRRYLIGNFNGHLQHLLMFVLDEAFWSGDKQAEGTLKDLITGTHHLIEQKGKETYPVENLTRVIIIGNEEWIVPASVDERRYAVLEVGSGRKQDRAYFQRMRLGMENGGYPLLLDRLLKFDLTGIDLNQAPATQALYDQKAQSLEPMHQWILDCLHEGKVVGSEWDGGWPEEIDKDRFRGCFRKYVRDRNIRSRVPDDRNFGKLLKKCLPKISSSQRRDRKEMVQTYRFPSLEVCRKDWQEFLNHDFTWE